MKYKEVKDNFKDPVCGMEVSKAMAPATYEYKRKAYYFCAGICRDKFEKEPDKYINKWLPRGL